MYAFMETPLGIRTYVHSYIHTHMPMYMRISHTCTDIYIHVTYMHTCIRAHMHTCTHAYIMPTYLHAYGMYLSYMRTYDKETHRHRGLLQFMGGRHARGQHQSRGRSHQAAVKDRVQWVLGRLCLSTLEGVGCVSWGSLLMAYGRWLGFIVTVA